MCYLVSFMNSIILVFLINIFIIAASLGYGLRIFSSGYCVITGLAGYLFILFLMGVGSLFSAGSPLYVAAVLALGVFFFLQKRGGSYKELIDQGRFHWLAMPAGLSVFLIYIAYISGFPAAYNFHDDFQKYFIHPVKFIQDGSIWGSPLSTIGKETFGGQALSQSIFVSFIGVPGMNIFDSVFCRAMISFFIFEFAARHKNPAAGILCGVLAQVIHAQYVNVSSLYSISLLCTAAVIIHHEILTKVREGFSLGFRALGLLLGVVYAAAISLKTSNIALPLFHFPVVVFSIFYSIPRERIISRTSIVKDLLAWSLTSCFSGFIFLLPFIINPMALLLESFSFGEMAFPSIADPQKISLLFSSAETFYGGAPLYFFLLFLLPFTGFFLRAILQGISSELIVGGSAILSLLLILGFFITFVGADLFSFSTALRYSIPYLIGFSPISFLLFFVKKECSYHLNEISIGPSIPVLFALASVLALISLFTPVYFKFVQQYFSCGSSLSFSAFACSDDYRAYNRYVLNGSARARILKLQAKVPPGETILAWTDYSFLLDFSRNRIIEVDTAGLRNPWAIVPETQYFMLSAGGLAHRTKEQFEAGLSDPSKYDRDIWSATLGFINFLENNVKVLGADRDNDLVLYRVSFPEIRKFHQFIPAASRWDSLAE